MAWSSIRTKPNGKGGVIRTFARILLRYGVLRTTYRLPFLDAETTQPSNPLTSTPYSHDKCGQCCRSLGSTSCINFCIFFSQVRTAIENGLQRQQHRVQRHLPPPWIREANLLESSWQRTRRSSTGSLGEQPIKLYTLPFKFGLVLVEPVQLQEFSPCNWTASSVSARVVT